MASLEELERRIAKLQKQVDAIPSPSPALNTLSQSNDVKIGGTTPLADGHALVFDGSRKAWTNQTGVSASLLTNSFYEYIDDGTSTGHAYNSGDQEVLFTASGLSAFNQGSDVTLASGRAEIVTTGVYSIAATWDVLADTAADTYSYARGRFTLDRSNEPGSPTHDSVFLDDLKVPAVVPASNKHAAYFTASITAFMYAGDQVKVETIFTAGSSPGSTWSYVTASLYIERLA